MYATRIQLINYGPIRKLDLSLPIVNDQPKTIVFVGENGSGKSIVLSHIVNAIVSAQAIAYPGAPEVDLGKVYKLRSSAYIRSSTDCYFTRIDFDNQLHIAEIHTRERKQEDSRIADDLSGNDGQAAWNALSINKNDHLISNFDESGQDGFEDVFSKNCILYFPSNRFEEPAWLNESNLKSKASYTAFRHIRGSTDRKVINHSPLNDVRDWLFDLVYDRAAFEIQTSPARGLAVMRDNQPPTPLGIDVPLFMGYHGSATRTYEAALSIVRSALGLGDTGRIGIGQRSNRTVSIVENDHVIVPNLFQLSSGETALLNLFLSVLRDFDLTGALLKTTNDIRGIVVVDEIDLHLHATHQYEIVPRLIAMFPNVQFLISSHSPLFVLGLRESLGNDGFGLYELPQGQQIDAEQFDEFGSAYRAFRLTTSYLDDVRRAVEESRKPIVFLDGATDVAYLERAASLLNCKSVWACIEARDGGGEGNLKSIWKASRTLRRQGVLQNRIMLLHDCDSDVQSAESEVMFRRKVPRIDGNPIERGIENLFSKETLQRAREYKPAFIDISPFFIRTQRGIDVEEPERWTVNEDEKANLCQWLCDNGTEEDFRGFREIFKILGDVQELLGVEGVEAAS